MQVVVGMDDAPLMDTSKRILRISSDWRKVRTCSFPGPGAKVLRVSVSLEGVEMQSRARWIESFVAVLILLMTSGSRY